MGDATAVSTVFRVFFVFTFTYPFAPVVAQLIAEPNFNNCCQKLSFQSLSASGPCEAEYDSKFFHGGKDSSTAEQREISDKVTQASWRNPSPSFLESDIIPAGILVTVAEHGLSYLKGCAGESGVAGSHSTGITQYNKAHQLTYWFPGFYADKCNSQGSSS